MPERAEIYIQPLAGDGCKPTRTMDTTGGFVRATGTEARVCELIARRQQMGVAKYGTTVAENPLALRQWAQHALEEALDLAIYLQRFLEELDKETDDGR